MVERRRPTRMRKSNAYTLSSWLEIMESPLRANQYTMLRKWLCCYGVSTPASRGLARSQKRGRQSLRKPATLRTSTFFESRSEKGFNNEGKWARKVEIKGDQSWMAWWKRCWEAGFEVAVTMDMATSRSNCEGIGRVLRGCLFLGQMTISNGPKGGFVRMGVRKSHLIYQNLPAEASQIFGDKIMLL